MIGDVSGHGYQAALIMALAMSASAIHAQAPTDPARDARGALYGTLREELTTTEMFISAFYGVIDRERGELRYANTGHPHAFLVARDGTIERLAADRSADRHGRDAPRRAIAPWDRRAAICCCCSPTASATRATASACASASRPCSTSCSASREPPDADLRARLRRARRTHRRGRAATISLS